MASTTLSRSLSKRLREIVGRDNVLTDRGELLPFESDGLTAHRRLPAAVVFAQSAEEVSQLVTLLYHEGIPYVPRGAGTGLSGGALSEGGVVIELSRMTRIVEIDADNRRARVEPGVLNTSLASAVQPLGLMYAPDPSSQTACTLGGNVAENSGGPHCLKYGVTTNHVIGLTVVLPDGDMVELEDHGDSGYDLVGTFVGSEGTLGICVEVETRLVPAPQGVETLLAHFMEIEAAGRAVSQIIATGLLPAALEMIDRETLEAVEASVFAAGFPTDVAASLIVELDGPAAGLAVQATRVAEILDECGAREVARAQGPEDRARFWRARKSAFGAMGRLAPDLLVQDATVPRSRLPEVLSRVAEIAGEYHLTITNVFHAGDGNLHPNIPFDRRDEELTARVHAASREIMRVCVAVGGTITGEHGVGIDKRQYMPLVWTPDDRWAMRQVKVVFDPAGLCNPGKILPDEDRPETVESTDVGPGNVPRRTAASTPESIGVAVERALGKEALLGVDEEIAGEHGTSLGAVAAPASIEEVSEVMRLASRSGWRVLPLGAGTWLTAGRPLARIDLGVSTARLPRDIDHQPDDLLATVPAGVSLSRLQGELADSGQWWPLDPLGDGTVGGAVATAAAGPLAAGYGTPRDLVLGLTAVLADGRPIHAGGRVVKNVAGYDLVRLLTGSWGTLAIITEAHLRLYGRPEADETRLISSGDPLTLLGLAREIASGQRLQPAAIELLSPTAGSTLGWGDDGWRMAIRWLGHPLDVEDAVTGLARTPCATRAGEGGGEIWETLRDIESRSGAPLVMRIRCRPTAMSRVLRLAETFVTEPRVVASPATGRIWVLGAASREEWVDEAAGGAGRFAELRRGLTALNARVRVEKGPSALRSLIDPWDEPEGSARLQRALKSRFDPWGVLKPGFFVAGI